ncbi:cytochrome P450 2J6-like [Pantherophis guttatus]|uniref:Cytochrome P450 2J6-like n=1 Tax=Pantherophis guttatus TaxID=94885 RepID=A0A6P9AY71_PANGU|nr:cytochrome P450 2J6-like [Pantherophis guttatus]
MMALSSIFLLLVLCLLIVQLVKLQLRRRHYPPGPTPLPFIGCLWHPKFFQLTRELLIEMSKIYGNIFTLWFGPYPLIILQGYQAVKDGLTTHPEDVSGRPLLPFFKTLANNKGILLSTGLTWKQQRRFSMAALKNLGLGKSALEYQIQEEAESLVEVFRKSEGKPMNPSFALNLAVSNVICAVVFGHRFSTEDKIFHHLLEAMEKIFNASDSVMFNLYNIFPWIMQHVPGRHQKAFCSRDIVQSFIREEIKKHQEADHREKTQDFIHLYLDEIEKMKNQPKSPYDEKNMVQSIFDLFLGGTETSGTTLHWGLLYMVLYPDIQAKVQKEIDTLLTPGQSICYEDRKKLPYTNAVIHEIQRFSNIISIGMPRFCLRDTKIQKFHIKKGTTFFPNMASALHDPNEWEAPLTFDPNHFLDKDGNFTCPEAFIPFSMGHRACLGDNLAKTELFLFFSNLVQTFNFHLADGSKDIKLDPIWGGTLKPHSFDICAIPREAHISGLNGRCGYWDWESKQLGLPPPTFA